MNPVLDMTLSFEARGVVAYLLAARRLDISVQGVRDLGLGRDTAYRVCYELELRGYFRKSGKSSYNFLILESSTPELPDVRNFKYELPNFLISGNQEDRTTIHRESSKHDQSVVVLTSATSQIPEIRKLDEPTQQPLIDLPEPTPPHFAAPSPPKKPRRKENPPEAKALYPALFELCKSGQHGGKAQGCRVIARNLFNEFGATPEQMAAFWEWFKMFSRAAQAAAKERRTVNAPLPKQVYADWREFLVWWEAKQVQAARKADERRRAEEEAAARAALPPDDAPRLTGRELYRRTFSLPRPAAVTTD
jgi:hypothetical protein